MYRLGQHGRPRLQPGEPVPPPSQAPTLSISRGVPHEAPRLLNEAPARLAVPQPPAFWQRRALNYLERYACLLIFAAYSLAEAKGGFGPPFGAWLRRHWSLRRNLKHLTLE